MEKGEKFSVALLGPSTVGKTTYVASLCEENVRQKLIQRSIKNIFGQTKIVCCYHFTAETEIEFGHISQIAVYRESIVKDNDDLESVELPWALKTVVNIDRKQLIELLQNKTLLVRLPVDLSIESIEKLDKEELSENIHHIVINVKGSKAFNEFLQEKNIEELTIRDVRGFGDELGEVMKDLRSNSRRWRKYYGYEDADGIILFDTSGGLFSRQNGEFYRKVIEEAIALKPLIAICKSELLTVEMNSGYKYWDIINNEEHQIWKLKKHKQVSSIILNARNAYRNEAYSVVIDAYTRRLFVADVDMDSEEQLKIYNETVLESSECLLKMLLSFRDAVVEAEKEYRDDLHYILMQNLYKNVKLPSEFVQHLSDKNGNWLDMVGERGGLTTKVANGDRVGKTIINVMDELYDAIRHSRNLRQWYSPKPEETFQDRQKWYLVFSLIDKVLYSEEVMDWRKTLSPTLHENIVYYAFEETHERVKKNDNLDETEKLKIFFEAIITNIFKFVDE